MKQGLTLMQLAQKVSHLEQHKVDYVADTRKLDFVIAGSGPDLTVGLDISGKAITPINHVAHRQFAERLNIPKKYYDKMLHDAPELLTRNANHWLQRNADRRLVRTLEGTTRAFLSDRYRVLDNYDLLEHMLPILQEQKEMRIISSQITDTHLYLKALFPRIEREVKVGDPVQAGVVISNSETGDGSVKVEPLVYTLICTNGMIAPISMKKYHVGRGYELNEDGTASQIYRDETLVASDKAFWMQAQDTLRAVTSERGFDAIVAQMRAAAAIPINNDPVEVVERTSKHFRLTDEERGGVLEHLIKGGDLSRYGLMNAVTRMSQDVESYDRATELERIGGRVLELPRNDWQRLAA